MQNFDDYATFTPGISEDEPELKTGNQGYQVEDVFGGKLNIRRTVFAAAPENVALLGLEPFVGIRSAVKSCDCKEIHTNVTLLGNPVDDQEVPGVTAEFTLEQLEQIAANLQATIYEARAKQSDLQVKRARTGVLPDDRPNQAQQSRPY